MIHLFIFQKLQSNKPILWDMSYKKVSTILCVKLNNICIFEGKINMPLSCVDVIY